MTIEREPAEPSPNRTIDEAIGQVTFWGEAWSLRLAAECMIAPYRANAHTELIPLTGPHGTCTSVHGRPYILLPEFRTTVQPTNAGEPVRPPGPVTTLTWEGMRAEGVGELQAWYYDADRLLVLWEAFLEDRYQTGQAANDANLLALWRGAEQALRRQFPQVARLVTPATDPLYDPTDYQQLLRSLGYAPVNEQAYGKVVTSA